jgi:hypothetical protein
MAGSTIDLVDVVSILCRYGVDGVDGGELPVDCYVLDLGLVEVVGSTCN